MLEKFFHPNSIVLVGASPKKDKVGGVILDNLKGAGFKGKIFPVNFKYNKIGEDRCYKSVMDIEETIDLAIIAIPADNVVQVVRQCAEKCKPIKNIIIISAGFGESGIKGEKMEKELQQLANDEKIFILGPNCLGLINATSRVNASFAKKNIVVGKVGLIMQSGALTTAMLDLAEKEDFGFSKVVTLGNKAVLDEVDFLNYLRHDKETKVIGIYVENLKRGRDFIESLKETTMIKSVVVIKAGDSKLARAAILSHTGAMTSETYLTKEAVLENGGIFCEDISTFIETIKLLESFKKPLNKKIVVITNAGGAGVLVTDLIEKSKVLELVDFSDKEKAEIKKILPEAANAGNPIDLLGDADYRRYAVILENLRQNKDLKLGVVLAIVTPQAQTDIKKISEVIRLENKKSFYPILPIIMGGEAEEKALEELKKDGLSNFSLPEKAIMALDNYFNKTSNMKLGDKIFLKINSKRSRKNLEMANNILNSGRQIFYFKEGSELLERYNLSVAENWNIGLDEQKKIIFPAVLKIDSVDFLHKRNKGGVIMDISAEAELEKAIWELRHKFPKEKLIAQKQFPIGLELILGIKNDDSYGLVLMLGIGGSVAEILQERIIWFLPLNKKDIINKIGNSLVGKIIKSEGIKISLVAENVARLNLLAMENKWIKELDINPMIFYRGQEAVAVDVKVIIKKD